MFGQKILQYTLALCKGHFDYIQLLPSHLLLRIVSYLNLKDTGQLAQTTEKFRKVRVPPRLTYSDTFIHSYFKQFKGHVMEKYRIGKVQLWRAVYPLSLCLLWFLLLCMYVYVGMVMSYVVSQLCNSPEFWEQIVRHRCDDFTADMEGLAKAMGWRNMYLNFFHKKKDQEAVDNQQGGSETPSA